ncbi:MAG TPA: flagellar filament capping protein FliD [Steroidobacteraceae bacterium]|nr:flagellar filament capping protein FliD [Steroidobacteraceae bacterium]
MASTAITATSNSSSTTSPVSVASNTSSGAAGGSVINVSSLVSQLVSAEIAPQQTLITNQTTAVTAQVSALGTLKGALSTFQSALSSLDSANAFNTQAATSSQTSSFTALAGSGASAGAYNVTVSSLASAQQIVSKPLAATGSVGDGTLQISLGSQNFTVTAASGSDSLADIADAINSSTSNPGVQATIIQGSDGAHLLLTSAQTGAANSISVSEVDTGGGLTALTYGTGNASHYTQQAAAADASYSIAGVAQTSASNTIANALPGVTLSLLAPTTGTGGTLSVANDTTTVQKNIDAFVSAYNTLQSTMSGLGSYDASTQTAGVMEGNPVLTGTQSQIQNVLYSFVGSSTYNSLASIGITTNSDGSLSVNDGTLTTALQTNFSAVSNLFSSTNGIAAQLNTQITGSLASNGTIGNYSTTLQTQENNLTKQSNQLQTQSTALTASLTEQYSALNALLSSLQTTSSQLSQTFATLPQVQSTQSA